MITASLSVVCPFSDDAAGVPRVRHEMGQNWDNYQQFILETQRASQTQAQEIKKLGLGCSVFRQGQLNCVSRTNTSEELRIFGTCATLLDAN